MRGDGNIKGRFMSKVRQAGGCWEWTGHRQPLGYGTFFWRNGARRQVLAHRAAYELLVGPIPEGLELDHLCRNRGCVRPDHLEPVTRQQNIARSQSPSVLNGAKTHCKAGHPLSGDNLYLRPGPLGGRSCRTCTAQWLVESRRRRATGVAA